MKLSKIFVSALAAAGVAAACALCAYAEADVVTVKVDNASVVFDQNPVIVGEGYTMVPIRAVFEQAGATVDWDQETQTASVTQGDHVVTIKYGDTAMYKNGERIELESPAIMLENRILIPVRAIAEAMDYAVTWDGSHSLVLVSTTGKPYRAHAFQKIGFRTLEDAAEFYSNGMADEYVDLDNDGKAERVMFSRVDYLTADDVVLKINDIDYTAGLGSLTSVYSIALVDIDGSDDTKELVVTENGDVLTAHFYRYEKGILKVINDETTNKPAEIEYASKILFSGTNLILADIQGACFVDIMVTGSVYRYREGAEGKGIKLMTFSSIDSILNRNLYNKHKDGMLYNVIYTDKYTKGSYKDINDTGTKNSDTIESMKMLDGYFDKDDKSYIELYVEFPDGARAVLKPYSI